MSLPPKICSIHRGLKDKLFVESLELYQNTPSEGMSLWNVKPLVGILPATEYGCGPPGDKPWELPVPHNSEKCPYFWTKKFEARAGLYEPFSTLQVPSVSSLRKVYSVREAREIKALMGEKV